MRDDASRDFQELAARFARDRLTPFAAQWERAKTIPSGLLRDMGELGFFGILAPEEYGGAQSSFLSFIVALEQIAGGNGAVSTLMHVHSLGTMGPILKLGTAEQKRTWISRMVSGEAIGAVCLTEPGAGSDVAGISTRAVRDGNGWRLNGTKQFITNGARASVAIILAVTDPAAGARGMTFFLVPAGTPGYKAGPPEEKMGQRVSDTTQIFLEECWVPDDAILGGLNEAFRQTMGLLSDGRISIAAQAVGMAQAAFDHALAYAKERRAFGKAIIENQAVAFRLADMAMKIDVARTYTYAAARRLDEGLDCVKEASMAKLFAAEMAERVCSDALQIHGGYGYLQDYPLERLCRDVRVCQIYEGTNDIQRLIIARRISA